MRTLVDKYWDRIDCEFALNEGGAAEVDNGKVAYIGVATAEKIPRGVTLRATAPAATRPSLSLTTLSSTSPAP